MAKRKQKTRRKAPAGRARRKKTGSNWRTALAMLVSTTATQIHFFITQPLSALVQPLPVYAYGAAMALFSTSTANASRPAVCGRVATVFFSTSARGSRTL